MTTTELVPTFWVIDALRTVSFPPFVFWQYDPEHEVILANFTIQSDAPGYVIGVIHEEGIEGADEFLKLYEDVLKHLLGDKYTTIVNE